MEKTVVLEMRGISKRFGKTIANEDINLSLYKGEIHALLGENGAGKSTLMNILLGFYKPNSGEIYAGGKKVHIRSPKRAAELGIGMVHQHFQLIPTLSVAENVYLSMEHKDFIVNHTRMEEMISGYSEKFNLPVDPRAKIWQLSVGEQQRVEIMKILCRNSEILILDEPSAVLTPQEAKELFRTLRKMAGEGKSVIVISHKMNEVMENADRITVLKGGRIEDEMLVQDATIERLTRAVVGARTVNDKPPAGKALGESVSEGKAPEGKALEEKVSERKTPEGKALEEKASEEKVSQGTFDEIPDEKKKSTGTAAQTRLLEIDRLSAENDKGLTALKEISFHLNRSEIFGIAGVAGSGQRELAEVLAGLRKVKAGTIKMNGNDITDTKAAFRISEGISFIPEDRLHMGLVPAMDMKQNAILKKFRDKKYSRFGILRNRSIQSEAENYITSFEIKNGGMDLPVGLMSGGNQQKLLVAREINGDPAVIIAAYPVRGLDIGATESIHRILLKQRERGACILLISEELDELFALSDRIGVLCDGKLMGVRDRDKTDYEEIGRMMSGEEN